MLTYLPGQQLIVKERQRCFRDISPLPICIMSKKLLIICLYYMRWWANYRGLGLPWYVPSLALLHIFVLECVRGQLTKTAVVVCF